MTDPQHAIHLRTEYLEDPLGLDETAPRFSWWVEDTRPGAAQSAYRIRVASTAEALASDAPDLWDSGVVQSSEQNQIAFAGAELTSRQAAVWDVQLWDADGTAGPVSDPARFELGLLAGQDWQAQWIETPLHGTHTFSAPVPLLSTSFAVDQEVCSARLYITACGLYRGAINGQAISDDWFRPGLDGLPEPPASADL